MSEQETMDAFTGWLLTKKSVAGITLKRRTKHQFEGCLNLGNGFTILIKSSSNDNADTIFTVWFACGAPGMATGHMCRTPLTNKGHEKAIEGCAEKDIELLIEGGRKFTAADCFGDLLGCCHMQQF